MNAPKFSRWSRAHMAGRTALIAAIGAASLLPLAAPLAAAEEARHLGLAFAGLSGVDRRQGERIIVIADRAEIPADGESTLTLIIQAVDRNGKPLKRDVLVTVETTYGRILTPDLEDQDESAGFVVDNDRRAPGVQLTTKEGKAQVMIGAPEQPGPGDVIVSSGGYIDKERVRFTPEMRPLITVGLLEGILRASKRDNDDLTSVRVNDGLEDELGEIGVSRSGDDLYQAQGRAAVFSKGEIGNNFLLTTSFDSDTNRTRFFRDIQPDQFYPIYGDSSLRGFEAQTTRNGYLRIDKNRHYFLFGDLLTENETNDARSLAAYSRTLTGGRQHFEGDQYEFDLYAARDSLRRVIDEQPGRGISGPYQLSNGDGIENSEQVEIVVRDRNQPAVIRDVQRLSRFTDYEFEPFSGRILFRRPIPTVDSALNPVSIRVTYEIESGGDAFWVGGAKAAISPVDWLELGASYAEDDDPLTPYRLFGGHLKFEFGEQTTWVIEGAKSDRDGSLAQLALDGDGYRSEFKHVGDRLEARAFWGDTDDEFDNPTAQLTSGRKELGADLSYLIGEQTDISVEALQTEDALVGADRTGAKVSIGHDFDDDTYRLALGVRYGKDEVNPDATNSNRPTYSSIYNFTPPGSLSAGAFSNGAFANGPLNENEFLTATARFSAQLQERLNGYIEGDVPLDDSDTEQDAYAYALGLDYLIHDQTRIYARHERANSLAGLYGLGTDEEHSATLVGLDTNYREDGQLFTEYRLRDAISGRDSEAAVGLRNLFRLSEGLALSTSLERLQALSGEHQEANAVALGLEYTASERNKGSTRLEWREDPFATSWLSTLAWTTKLSRDWSLLFRNLYNRSENQEDALGTLIQDRAIIGAAYRDTDTNIWNSLMRYELKFERDDAELDPLNREAHIVSAHINVKPSRPLTVSGQIAAKWLDEDIRDAIGKIDNDFDAQLIAGRVLYDFTERWDLGVNASYLRSGDGAEQYGLGLEVGRVVMDNLWVSLGYNFAGYADDDFVDADYSRQGVYLRLRFKFDEKLFRGDDPNTNNSMTPETR